MIKDDKIREKRKPGNIVMTINLLKRILGAFSIMPGHERFGYDRIGVEGTFFSY